MAIDTNDKKLALMEWDMPWEPGLPLDETAGFDQGDKQQLLLGYPGILWAEITAQAFRRNLQRMLVGR